MALLFNVASPPFCPAARSAGFFRGRPSLLRFIGFGEGYCNRFYYILPAWFSQQFRSSQNPSYFLNFLLAFIEHICYYFSCACLKGYKK